MIICSTFLDAWVLILATIGIGERVHLQSLVDRSHEITVGASAETVLDALGEPRTKWDARSGLSSFLFGDRPAQWIYGTTIDVGSIILPGVPFPNPLPLNIRLFEPDDDDLVIEWTADAKVAEVVRPDLQVPENASKFIEPVYFVADLFRLFKSQPR